MKTTDLVLLSLFVLGSFGNEERPLVKTPLGAVRGYIKTSFEGHKFSAFEGIPYAKPPVGSKRFEAPEPAEPWTGTWDAVHLTECAQIGLRDYHIIQGHEDCLHINVYVPRQQPDPSNQLNVIVHIHGGAYMYGSGHMYARPEILMDKDIIFVHFNYRLGILGFLSTEDDVIPGNNGMKDQVLALKWVQENIASFGGNPKSVTLTGLSAGGVSAHLHYFSAMSKNLFHRGFSQSGTALSPFATQEGALQKAKILAAGVGCPLTPKEMKDCLKQRTYREILGKMDLFFVYKTIPIGPFVPIIEKGSEPFIDTNPFELLIKGQVHDVPWIASTVSHEGFFPQILSPQDLDYFDKNWDTILPILLDFDYNLDESQWSNAAQKIKNFYFEDGRLTTDNFIRMFGDRTFLVDAETSAKMQAKANKSPVYYFHFSYPGDHNEAKIVGHGGDAKYYFGSGPFSENEIKMKNILVDMLVTYATTGVPTIKGVDWKPTEHEKFTYLNISTFEVENIKLKTVEQLTPRKFWTSLKLQENENLFSVKDEL